MIIVSDTTAITSLLKIGRVDLLEKLFREVLIPGAVRDELLRYHTRIPEFLQVRMVAQSNELQALEQLLDPGEAEAIVLAEERGADALLIDEKKARLIAENRGIRCLGLAGALLMAKENLIIPDLGEILDSLEIEANFYLEPDLKRSILMRAGELS